MAPLNDPDPHSAGAEPSPALARGRAPTGDRGQTGPWPLLLEMAAWRRAMARRDGSRAPDEAPLRRLRAAAEAAARSPSERDLISLYRPILDLTPGTGYRCAHLGQSIDGRIATRDGQSRGLNGQANLIHLHRMRALCDAILVGGQTVAADDPLLTTRLVEGPNPVRVLLDGRGRIDDRYGLCRDGEAPTLVLSGGASGAGRAGQAEIIRLPLRNGRLPLGAVVDVLAARGLHVLFIEGGGVTVSRFLQAGLLDRLQVTIAPVLLGDGIPGLCLDSIGSVAQAPRPPVRQFALGEDRLWDFDLAAGRGVHRPGHS